MKDIKFPFLDLTKVDAPYAETLKEAACRVIDSGSYIGGQEVENFENKLAALTHTRHAVGVANGLDALRLSLRAAIICGYLNKGDEVIVPANTYIASILAISDAGLKPVLVDPDEETMCFTSAAISPYITPRTKGLMLVHLYGRIAFDNKMAELINHNNLFVIEDAAQSICARSPYAGINGTKQCGSLGHVAAFSFYPTKNIGAVGDAGAVTTNNEKLATTVRALANYGSDIRYHNIYKGFNSRLDPIQAAMLSVKLDKNEEITANRFANVVAYFNTIDNPLVTLPYKTSFITDCVWHQFVVRSNYRDELRAFLYENGVATDVHYPTPPHLQSAYAEFADKCFPITEKLCKTVISLPVAPGSTSVKDASDIGRIINKFRI